MTITAGSICYERKRYRYACGGTVVVPPFSRQRFRRLHILYFASVDGSIWLLIMYSVGLWDNFESSKIVTINRLACDQRFLCYSRHVKVGLTTPMN